MAPQPFTQIQVGSAISLGVLSLMMSGLMPLFLGALEDAHRLTPAGIGQLATVELLSAAITTGLAGAILKARNLRMIAVIASLGLAATNIATLGLGGAPLMIMRALAGVAEGVLLWLVVGLVARTPAPDRTSGVLFTGMAAAQLLAALVLALLVMPRYGADGGFLLIGGLSALGVLAACLLPHSYGPPPPGMQGGTPPLRGGLALLAVFAFQASVAGAGVYIMPLAHQAGISDGDAQMAVSIALALEVLGAGAATAVAGRANYKDVFLIGGGALLAALVVYATRAPPWLFIAVSGAVGFFSLLVMPFFVSMTIQADPSRRAAVQIGGAQLLGGALGPVMDSFFVSGQDSRSALIVSGILLMASLALILWLAHAPRAQARNDNRLLSSAAGRS